MSLVGRLEDLALSDIFQILSVGRKTGTLIIKSAEGSAVIVFKNGMVHRAESDFLEKSIGEAMFEGGYLKKSSALDMALEVKKKLPDKSITEILNELGAIKKETLEKFTKKRVERLVSKLLNWQEGDFQFELDDLSVHGKIDLDDFGWELQKGVSPEYLLMEGARVFDESSAGMMMPEEEIEEEPGAGGWEDDWSDVTQPEKKDMSALMALTQELRFPSSASEITLLVLRFASELFQRGVLFMAGEDEILGLGQFGLEIDRADEKIREIKLPVSESPFLNGIVNERRPYRGKLEKDRLTERLIGELNGAWPDEVSIFPLIAEEKVVALLYCDNPSGASAETDALEIFISQAGLALEKALLKRRIGELEKKGR